MRAPGNNSSYRRQARFTAAVVLWLLALAPGLHAQTTPTPAGMVLIPAGSYRPLFGAGSDLRGIAVKAFYLDTVPVSIRDYLEFVRANPEWRRSGVKRIFADASYLKTWAADQEPGTNAPLDRPVTDVSWFAARAYARWKDKRLPTTAEWELAAAASPDRADGENDPVFRNQILQWYTTGSDAIGPVGEHPANFYGVHDMHGLVWEWVLDFNNALVTGDSRADSAGLESGLFCGGASQRARNVNDYPAFMRTAFRTSLEANYCVRNLGFRCAQDL